MRASNRKNMESNPEFFISPSRGRRNFLEVMDDLEEFVGEDEASRYAIVVGTDSAMMNGSGNGIKGLPATLN